MLAALRFPELRLTCDRLWAYGLSTERLATTGGWVPTGCSTVDGCGLSVRSWRLGWLADAGTRLAVTTYPPAAAELPDTEYELASVPTNGRLTGFWPPYDPKFPHQKRHHAVNLRPKREAPRPGKRLM